MTTTVKIGLRIWQLADSQGYKKADFAREIGISRQTLDNWIAGSSTPDVDNMLEAARILDVSPGEIIGYREEDKNEGKPSTEPPAIPLYDGVISAGYGMEVNDDPVTGPTDKIYPGTWVKGAEAAMRIHGDSMFPEYRPGSTVALRRVFDYPKEIIWGEVYVVER